MEAREGIAEAARTVGLALMSSGMAMDDKQKEGVNFSGDFRRGSRAGTAAEPAERVQTAATKILNESLCSLTFSSILSGENPKLSLRETWVYKCHGMTIKAGSEPILQTEYKTMLKGQLALSKLIFTLEKF
jgi:hypothetical protein